jgi:hypothetical protein
LLLNKLDIMFDIIDLIRGSLDYFSQYRR